MKGTFVVGIYSVIMIGLFIVCCYLMTIVDPKPLPVERKSLYAVNDAVPNIYPRDSPLNYTIGYGLEKIPDGVDADEFRNTLMTTKYNYDVDQGPFERGQRVVPPVWPRVVVAEDKENVKTAANKSNSKAYETSLPAKGLRRSVDDKMKHQLENPGSVLLKIIDKSGRKKVEVKFVPREKIIAKERMLQLNKTTESISNETIDQFINSNRSSNMNITHSKDSILKLKANDIIVLTIDDDSDVLFDESVISTESTENDTNKILNSTKPMDLKTKEKEFAKEIIDKQIYTLNLLTNNENSTIANTLSIFNNKSNKIVLS